MGRVPRPATAQNSSKIKNLIYCSPPGGWRSHAQPRVPVCASQKMGLFPQDSGFPDHAGHHALPLHCLEYLRGTVGLLALGAGLFVLLRHAVVLDAACPIVASWTPCALRRGGCDLPGDGSRPTGGRAGRADGGEATKALQTPGPGRVAICRAMVGHTKALHTTPVPPSR